MSDMNLIETRERWIESLKRAASRARELAVAQQYAPWFSLANSLDEIRETGTFLASAASQSKQQIESDIQNYIEKKGIVH